MMRTHAVWKEKMLFSATSDGHSIELDAKAPIGTGKALTPKELLAIAISGCTAMDVAALLKKYKQPLEGFEVDADVSIKEGSKPLVFSEITLTFSLRGNLDREKVIEAVHLSQTQYCGVSAMVVKSVPIKYVILLNGEEIGRGEAAFS
jgi:putative redox protein